MSEDLTGDAGGKQAKREGEELREKQGEKTDVSFSVFHPISRMDGDVSVL